MTAVSELSVTGLPHARQNRLVSGISEAQDIQRAIRGICYCSIRARRAAPVATRRLQGIHFAFERCELFDYVFETWRIAKDHHGHVAIVLPKGGNAGAHGYQLETPGTARS